ncbi:putative bifunctional diguanylate cyclase/phosphodiesterase [Glycocaulis sp.]|uniref:putative bifunctional diguanylate cyclase/phosphodiesterase n=1 Tax=Glycocaulis sp. TaxID=1969725 RepID=UPI003F6F210C
MRVFTCLFTEHNLWFVLLAAIMCVVGASVTIRLYRQVTQAEGLARIGWAFLAAICAGSAIWTTHFIAMLGYQPGTAVTLDAWLTIASGLIAIAGSGVAFLVATNRHLKFAPLFGGALLGLTISAMHFTGMFAYRVDGIVTWDGGYIAVAIVLAVVFSAAALHLTIRWQGGWRCMVPALTLVTGIVLLHFTGMAAFMVEPILGYQPGASSEAFTVMAVAVAIAGVLILGTGLATFYIEKRMRETQDAQLRHMALHDPLTGLPNRTSFYARLDARLAGQYSGSTAVAAIDLNRFKEINDGWGHAAGDHVLCELAERLRKFDGARHFAARLGGDEFCVILKTGDELELQKLVQQLEALLSESIAYGALETSTGGSIGVAVYPRDGEDRDALVRNADLAMYRAKSDPLINVCFYDSELGDIVRERRQLANDLRHAIDNDELALHYQVQTAIGTGEVRGYEALLRWTHPAKGPISPADFIPLAEANGLILPLGDWVLRKACVDAVSWPHPHKVAVNLSAIQLTHIGLPQQIHQVLIETGLPPSRLEIELTETALIKDKVQSLHIMRQIKALGVSIALDDFGTGYSSLDTLRTFPFDKIKLDKSFTDELKTDQRSLAVVRAVLALAKSLSIPVLAEGIETQEQLDLLHLESCDEGQGFLLGRPAPIDVVAQLGTRIRISGANAMEPFPAKPSKRA